MGRFALAIMLAALSACSAGPADQGSAPDAQPAAERGHASEASAVPEPTDREGPSTTEPAVSLRGAAYCLGPADNAGSAFDNAKECFMLACSLRDRASCGWAATYNGSGPPIESPPTGSSPRANSSPARWELLAYVEARRTILDSGWQPLSGPCEGFVGDEVCRKYPEIGNCSGTGLGFCDMHFERNGHCLVVITTGGHPRSEEPGETHVEDVVVRKGPCDKGNTY